MTKDKSNDGDGEKPKDGILSVDPALKQAMEELRKLLVNTAFQIPEVDQSEKMLTALVTHAFYAAHGIDVGSLKAELEFSDAELAELDAIIADNAAKMRNTPRWLLSNPRHQNRGEDALEAVPFKEWRLRHKLEYPILWMALPAMLTASFLSAKSALLSSGLPVYVENPILMAAVASIPGFGAIMLKSLGSLFASDAAQKRYAFGIFGMAAGALGVWAVTFADSFHGIGGGTLDIFSDKPVWKEKLLVGAQLAFEFFGSTAIYLRIERLSKAYDPDTWFRNLEFDGFEDIDSQKTEERADLRKVVAHMRGVQISQHSALDLQIELALASLRAKRARGNDPTL
ncbi:hypothetical protein [uncultured Tateyamaria sp.]|uniref:hypothetical protein n=1 Tax=uncultured Tateyamaria sp. TaxID=455651 RepID=UPI00261BEFE7|nr:hypothetical protein [uncultured Tateyamaria sp.]